LALGLAGNGAAQATNPVVITNLTQAALLEAMAGGGWVVFAGDGTVVLTGGTTVATNTVLDGTGHSVVLSGGSGISVPAHVTLTMSNLTIQGGNAPWGGGGVYNDGTVNVVGCTFSGNTATAQSALGAGGAVLNYGTLNVVACTFSGNTATGPNGVNDPEAATYSNPEGDSTAGTDGRGGAICNYGALSVEASTFLNNRAVGGTGGNGASGFVYNEGPAFYDYPPGPINACPGFWGGAGGGGAIYNSSTARIVNSTFSANTATGGAGGAAGWPGYYICSPTSNPLTYYNVYGTVAPGGPGGGAYGAVCNDGFWAVCALVNCTLVGNSATGGAGGTGEPDGGTGTAQGGVGGATLVNTLLVADRPADVFTDHGRNLVSASASGVVGPLTNNGGPTLTMALLAGSPAIGQGNPGPAPSTDQRGIPRPVGVAVVAAAGRACLARRRARALRLWRQRQHGLPANQHGSHELGECQQQHHPQNLPTQSLPRADERPGAFFPSGGSLRRGRGARP
jgi:hypothetical protein